MHPLSQNKHRKLLTVQKFTKSEVYIVVEGARLCAVEGVGVAKLLQPALGPADGAAATVRGRDAAFHALSIRGCEEYPAGANAVHRFVILCGPCLC